MQNNCKDCKNRTIGCHSTCEDYKQYRENLNAENEVIKKSRAENFIKVSREAVVWSHRTNFSKNKYSKSK